MMYRWCLFLTCLALCSHAASAIYGHRLSNLRSDTSNDFHTLSESVSESSAELLTAQDLPPNYSGQVTHVPLKATYRVDFTKVKHVERDGVKLMTIDSPLIGCPMMDFSAPVRIGTQGPFELIVDTGSTSLGVAATTCGATCPVASEYNPATTGTQLGATFASTFGDGSGWSGPAVSDAVSISGSTATTIQLAAISTQTRFFRAASCQNPNAGPSPSSGIIGFAFAGLGVQGKNAAGANVAGVKADAWFIKNAAASGKPAVFAIRMCMGSGDLFLNGYDTNSFTDQIHWANVAVFDYIYAGKAYPLPAGNDFWTVAVTSIGPIGGTIDNNVADFQGNGVFGVNTIVDSGTTVALLPPAAVADLVNAIPVATFQGWFGVTPATFFANYQCAPSTATSAAMNAALPKSIVTIANTNSGTPVSITLNGMNFLLQQVSTTGTTVYCSGVLSNGATFAANTDVNVILGWSFMNQMIVVHDTKNSKIGFAPRTTAGCPDGTAGAVAITGGDVAVVDPTGGTGQSTVGGGAATTAKPAATTTAAMATPFPIPANPCATLGCPSKNTNCATAANGASGTTAPVGVPAAQCIIAFMKVTMNINLANGAVTAAAAATTATALFNALMNFIKMNNNVAVNLDAAGIALKAQTLTFTLDVTSVQGAAATKQAALDLQNQATANAFAASGVGVASVTTCPADQVDANGMCTTGGGGMMMMNLAVLIGAVIGAVVAVGLIALGVVMYRRRRVANKSFNSTASNIRSETRTEPAHLAPPPTAAQAWSNPYNAAQPMGGQGQQTYAWNNQQ